MTDEIEIGAFDVKRGATQAEGGLWTIDLGFQDRAGVIAAYLVTDGREVALVETGPSTCLVNLDEGIRRAGLKSEWISKVLVTHIHLDHSGAAGVLARRNPNLKVYVHPLGAPHLIDPSKLVASAARIYGENMERFWGEIAPVPAEQVVALTDGETLTVAGRKLDALFTPGHAKHHVAFVDREEGTAFTGDVGGIHMQHTDYLCAPTPPPDLDPEAWRESIAKLKATRVRRLYLTHFGACDRAQTALDATLESLERFLAFGEAAYANNSDQPTLTAELHAEMARGLGPVPEGILVNLEWATPSYMAAMGLARLFTKRGVRS